jgi:hypothetical protein
LEIDDEALALIAEFMVAITLTADSSFWLLPHAAWNRPPSEDEQDARERAEKEVARFFDAVQGLNIRHEDDPALKVINNRRLWRGKMDWASGMALLIDVRRKRRRRERSDREVAEALRELGLQGPPKVE